MDPQPSKESRIQDQLLRTQSSTVPVHVNKFKEIHLNTTANLQKPNIIFIGHSYIYKIDKEPKKVTRCSILTLFNCDKTSEFINYFNISIGS